jgi:hypothetical protein
MDLKKKKKKKKKKKQKVKEITFNFSIRNAGLIIFLCLTHFSPSYDTTPKNSNLESGFIRGFRNSPIFVRTSFICSGSVIYTLGFGPIHIKKFLPAYISRSEEDPISYETWEIKRNATLNVVQQ